MEEVLDLYHEPYNEQYPQVCFDESNKQLIGEVAIPLPPIPGQVARYDYEYERNGVSNLFMFFEPLRAWRYVEVTDHRTMIDFAHCMRRLVDEFYPNAIRIRVVLDNLNTHKPASLYAAFPPDEAQRILSRLEFHFTPKHGSWLNMAEIELAVLARQCLDRRIPDKSTLQAEVTVWQRDRNAAQATVKWQFSTSDARIKLHRLYPSLEA
jgi:hypothetical protein